MSGHHPRGLHAALGFFTAIPVPPVMTVDAVTGARAIRSFWLAGVVVGAIATAVGTIALLLGATPLLAAALYLGALTLVTGAIHLDGLADTADGLGSRKDPADALTIMRKSDIGPMGVATLVVTLLVEVACLESLAQDWRALVLAGIAGPAVARLTMLGATQPSVRMARSSGFGALFGGVTPRPLALAATAAAPVVVGLAGWWAHGSTRGAVVGAGAAVAACMWAWLWRRHLVGRLTGMTGDTFGSIIELSQACCWLVLAVAW